MPMGRGTSQATAHELVAPMATPSGAASGPSPSALLRPHLRMEDLAPDHGWVEVWRHGTRYWNQSETATNHSSCSASPRCASPWWLRKDYVAKHGMHQPVQIGLHPGEDCHHFGTVAEGLSIGSWGDCGPSLAERLQATPGMDSATAREAANCSSLWNYGVWFYPMKGSGVQVNVGRSLRANTREDVSRALGLPCEDDAPFCDHAPSDKLWCHLALFHGYDSIQMARAHLTEVPEIVICNGTGAAAVTDTCPPVALRAAAGGACRCDESQPGLNCGAGKAVASVLSEAGPCVWPTKLVQDRAGTQCVHSPGPNQVVAAMWHDACEKGHYTGCVSCGSLPPL